MKSSGRRMRRSRELVTSSDESLSGFDLYGVQGNSAAALDIFTTEAKDTEASTLVKDYNCLLLSHAIGSKGSKSEILMSLEDMEIGYKNKKPELPLSERALTRNDMIMAYNRALVLHAAGDYDDCTRICTENLNDLIASKQKPPEELSLVASRMAFLLVECVLSISVGRNSGLQRERLDIPSIDSIIDWLDLFDMEKDPQLKFLLTMYKSRLDLAELDEVGKHVDSKIRSARKELKVAMEVFQHKLRPSFGADSGSVVSSANSEENMSLPTQHDEHPPPPSSFVLQKLNRSALNLKANLEQLKGNTKKSLILCSEALAAATDNSSYEAVHSNNLAAVYETNNKRHLALHALTKSLRANSDASLFHEDGTARPDQSFMILHNAAICALQARNYLAAYECMATCVSRCDIFRDRPRCWLRMAEACIGIFSQLKSQEKKFSTVEQNGEPYGIVFGNSLFNDDNEITREELVATLASPEDLEQVKVNPMLRARASLEYAMKNEEELGPDALVSARLSMAYICLAFCDYKWALEMTKLVLASSAPADEAEEVRRSLYKRQIATARMYAAEASCALGEMVDAMKFLVGDGQADAFDRLASDLGGVTIATAASNSKGKRRLASAQTMVRSTACAVTAAMGNASAAKQLANTAQAFASDQERSSAIRALIYTLLREGQKSPALTLLLSMR